MNSSIIQSMINAIDRPAIYITPDYVIQAVNQAYRDTYETEVVVGTSTCFAVSHENTMPCDKHGEDCPIQQCTASGRASSVVHIHSTATGKSYCDIVMKPVKDEDGITVGFLEILDRIRYASAESAKNMMIGSSAAFKAMLNQINRAAQADIAVLLQGDTGTGKELVAQALHDSSRRKDKPFVVIECTGLNENLFESELFGHEKGAFTGATSSKKGLIEVANGGTVFFDEIGDVPLNMQVKLLRLLETQSFRAVGGLQQKKANFRLICASHKNLLELVERGDFRRDLYYRIAGFPIHLPSLAQRKEDISTLACHFLAHSEYHHKTFSNESLEFLSRYPFPGNIRELKSIVEHAALLTDDDVIEPHNLPPQVQNALTASDISGKEIMTLDEAEEAHLRAVCQRMGCKPDEVSKALGCSTRTLYRKLQRYGIKVDGKAATT